MATNTFDSKGRGVKNWWISLFLGILLIALGFWVLQTPLESYISLSLLFSAFIFLSGLFWIAFSVSNINYLRGWRWYLAGGILDLMISVLLMTHPMLTMTILPYYIGFWLLFGGIMAIGTSLHLKSLGTPGWGWLLSLGLVTVVFSFLLLANPIFAGLGIVYMTAFSLITMGVFRVIFAFKLRKMHKNMKD